MTEHEVVDILRGVPVASLATIEDLPPELAAKIQSMMTLGATVVDVATVLDGDGYSLVILPAEDDSEAEDDGENMAEPDGMDDGEMPEADDEWDDEEDEYEETGGLVGLLDRLRTVFGKAITFEAENRAIARNRKRAAARAPHEFVRAVWATRKGVVRCRTCGGPQPADGELCPGIVMRKDAMPDMESMDDDEMMTDVGDLTLRSATYAQAMDMIVDALGCWSQRDAHYMEPSPFVADGLACVNCVAYCPETAGCYWVDGAIAPEGLCKLWVIPDALRKSTGSDVVVKEIVEQDGQFCVTSADGTQSFGCYPTRGEAEARLAQVEQFSKAAYKTEDGDQYPAEAYAYVPDPEMPSTWKLRLWDNPTDKETVAQVSRAVAALSGSGFRGNRVVIPAADLPAVKDRVRAAWRKVNGPDRELPPVIKADTFSPPAGVREEAKRALNWIAEGEAGSGFTDVGRKRASDLAAGRGVSLDTIKRMASFLARHEVDKKGEGWSPGEPGYPSPGRVAWAAWGGDPAVSWTRSVLDSVEKDSPTVTDVHVDVPMGSGGRPKRRPPSIPSVIALTDVRNAADGDIQVGSFVSWDSSGGTARGKVERVVTDGKINVPDSSFTVSASDGDPAVLIRLWTKRQDGWVATGQRVGHKMSTLTKIEPLDKSTTAGVFAKADERRFTLGPWYVPDSYDAHGEWTDSTELQSALWDYVRNSDRQIRLQHNVDVVAGEWVEALTWPYEVNVPMLDVETGMTVEHQFPPGTVFMGVVWEPWAWDLVKQGKIRGYSMGGAGQRVMVDLPMEGQL